MSIKALSIQLILLTAMIVASCGTRDRQSSGFTEAELALIHDADSIMRVLTIDDPEDLAVLRAVSCDLSAEALLSEDFSELARLMVATVTHPSQDGVGIAGPQVGLNRRVVAVQRFDKEDEPFEVYPNVRIVWASDSLEAGPEGCLSVPNRRGEVMRSQKIVIEYADIAAGGMRGGPERGLAGGSKDRLAESSEGGSKGGSEERSANGSDGRLALPVVRDTISGFTAVIFQHEIDHLDGVLYIDRL